MEDNTASLKNNAAVSGEVTDQRGVWWRQRDALNSSVEEIMTRIENEWFKKVGLDTFILCKDINEATPSAYPSGTGNWLALTCMCDFSFQFLT